MSGPEFTGLAQNILSLLPFISLSKVTCQNLWIHGRVNGTQSFVTRRLAE